MVPHAARRYRYLLRTLLTCPHTCLLPVSRACTEVQCAPPIQQRQVFYHSALPDSPSSGCSSTSAHPFPSAAPVPSPCLPHGLLRGRLPSRVSVLASFPVFLMSSHYESSTFTGIYQFPTLPSNLTESDKWLFLRDVSHATIRPLPSSTGIVRAMSYSLNITLSREIAKWPLSCSRTSRHLNLASLRH